MSAPIDRVPVSQPDRQEGRHWARAAILLIVLAAAAILLGRSARAQTSVLDPSGPQAAQIATVWWIIFALGVLVFVVVMALLGAAVLRARRRDGTDAIANDDTRPIFVGTAITTVIVVVLVGLSFWALQGGASPGKPTALTIEVAGHQYWWEVRYPEQNFITANEIHIPVGEPVAIRLTSDDVIHSFWVPELAGKMDLVPGRTNEFWIQADVPGVFFGECAEFCGIQHTLMRFQIVADPPERFAAWLDRESRIAAAASADTLVERGEQVFLGSACVYCHAVRGTAAASDFGPDLTHFASRNTLAAGVLENNRGNLAAWLIDPQAIKPGNLMPGFDYDADELEALLAYLESLE